LINPIISLNSIINLSIAIDIFLLGISRTLPYQYVDLLQSRCYINQNFRRGGNMSDQKKARPKVPEGDARFVTTRQMEANEKGYVGYQTTWESFQKEVPYETPKRP